jgi:hypothetical protein
MLFLFQQPESGGGVAASPEVVLRFLVPSALFLFSGVFCSRVFNFFLVYACSVVEGLEVGFLLL